MMEVTPHLKSVLKTYQHSATKSLQGPGLSLIVKAELPEDHHEHDEDDERFPVARVPFPIQQLPILAASDKTCSERSETVLEGQLISCFVVGGEKRLCLPQVLKSVLGSFTLPQINHQCDNLQIFCSRCTPEQLNVLKSQNVLPSSAASCGLITKTDAERLCSALLHQPETLRIRKGAATFRVYHECFGRCRGLCVPEMYTAKCARCVECLECHGWFSPQQFVCHVDRDQENRTVHWGFDSVNWRSYVLVEDDQIDHKQYAFYLDQMKERFEGKASFPPQPVVEDVAETDAVYKPLPFEWGANAYKRKLMHSSNAEMQQQQQQQPHIKQETVNGTTDSMLPLKKNKLEYHLPYSSFDTLCLPIFHGSYLPPSRLSSSPFSPFGCSPKELKLRQTIAQNNGTANIIPNGTSAAAAVTKTDFHCFAPKKHRLIRQHKEMERLRKLELERRKEQEVSSTSRKEEVIVKVEKEDLADSTSVSVVQPAARSLSRYNSEIELSTDTDDTASVSSDKCSDLLFKLEEILMRSVSADTRETVLKMVRTMSKEYEATVGENRTKDERIRELEAKVDALGEQLRLREAELLEMKKTPSAPPSPPPSSSSSQSPSGAAERLSPPSLSPMVAAVTEEDEQKEFAHEKENKTSVITAGAVAAATATDANEEAVTAIAVVAAVE